MNMILGMVQHLQMYSQAYSVVTLHVNQTHILLNILEFYLFIYLLKIVSHILIRTKKQNFIAQIP